MLGIGAVAGAELTRGAQSGSLWHEPQLVVALGVHGSENCPVSLNFWWNLEAPFGIWAVLALPVVPRGCAAGLGSGWCAPGFT